MATTIEASYKTQQNGYYLASFKDTELNFGVVLFEVDEHILKMLITRTR